MRTGFPFLRERPASGVRWLLQKRGKGLRKKGGGKRVKGPSGET